MLLPSDVAPVSLELSDVDTGRHPPNARFVPWDTPVSLLRSGFSLHFVRLRTSRMCRFEGIRTDLDVQTVASMRVLHKDFDGGDSDTVSGSPGGSDEIVVDR